MHFVATESDTNDSGFKSFLNTVQNHTIPFHRKLEAEGNATSDSEDLPVGVTSDSAWNRSDLCLHSYRPMPNSKKNIRQMIPEAQETMRNVAWNQTKTSIQKSQRRSYRIPRLPIALNMPILSKKSSDGMKITPNFPTHRWKIIRYTMSWSNRPLQYSLGKCLIKLCHPLT